MSFIYTPDNTALMDEITQRTMYIQPVDAKVVAATLLGTTENKGKYFYPTMARVKCVAANLVTIAASLTIGTNGSSYNNIMSTTLIAGVLATDNFINIPILGPMTPIAPNTPIYVRIGIAAVAVGGSQTIRVDLMGDYI